MISLALLPLIKSSDPQVLHNNGNFESGYFHQEIFIRIKALNPLTVEHDLPGPLAPDGFISGAVGHSALLGGVAFVQARGVNLEHIGGSQLHVEALEARDASSLVDEDDVAADAAVAGAPDLKEKLINY